MLEPAIERDADLQCSIWEIDLDDPKGPRGDYLDWVALSYVWGEKAGTIPITCDGKRLLVTPNCELALRYMRDQTRQYPLWVDAMVIDQANVAERSQQVTLMPEIYRKAAMVTVWLGKGNETSSTLLQILAAIKNGLGERGQLREAVRNELGGPYFPAVQQIYDKWDEFTGSDLSAEDVECLTKAEWYSRVWTLPELLLAKLVIVKCGHYYIDWDTFAEVVNGLILRFNFHPSADPYADRVIYRRWQARQLAFQLSQKVATDITNHGAISGEKQAVLLSACMFMNRLGLCTDPRDKVYAHFGLLAGAIRGLPDVDYAKSTGQVYEDIVRSTILSTRRFWPAATLDWRVEASSSYPSWIPHLDSGRTSDINYLYLLREFSRAWSLEEGESDEVERAEALQIQDVVIDTSINCNPGRLPLRGVRYATIVDKAQVWALKSDQIATTERDWAKRSIETVDNIVQLMLWLKFAREIPIKESCSNGDMATNRFEDLQKTFTMLGRHAGKRDVLESQFSNVLQWYENCVAEEQMSHEGSQMSRWVGNLMDNANCEAFIEGIMCLQEFVLFSTSIGSIGVTTAAVEAGDIITLFPGTNWPVILRQHDEIWRCVGASHVPTVMASSVWPPHKDMADLETFTLV